MLTLYFQKHAYYHWGGIFQFYSRKTVEQIIEEANALLENESDSDAFNGDFDMSRGGGVVSAFCYVKAADIPILFV